MPTSRASYRIIADCPRLIRRRSTSHRYRRLARFLISLASLLPLSSYAYGIYPESRSGPRYRNTPVNLYAHTYVRGACNTWGYNTRDESALSENARGLHTAVLLRVHVYMCHPRIHMSPIYIYSLSRSVYGLSGNGTRN